MTGDPLILPHGGYRKLKSFRIAQLVYDLTVRFCDQFIEKRSRTRDQMVQAARSAVQNIAEGSQLSGTSKKMELKLTNVARASLEELRLDYEDFLRQRGLPQWAPEHPALKRFKGKRCSTLEQVRVWVGEEQRKWMGLTRTGTDEHMGNSESSESVSVRVGPLGPFAPEVFVANAALSLLNLCCYLLDQQLRAQANAFERDGGFTERLYRHRHRNKGKSET
ncbi:MAG: four helix bundle protein [candidate division Zixibacteria bacterium]|nr:four helix bundle protein [candidate division Zixibacteria bacterium]